MAIRQPRTYSEIAETMFFGKRVKVLDLSREISPQIPVYPGHMKAAMWDHLTHAESRLRLGDSPFRGYAVKGIAFCDHDSTHIDAIFHFNEDRPDLTIENFPIENCFTEGVWIDVSDVPGRTHITLERVRRAMDEAGVEGLPAEHGCGAQMGFAAGVRQPVPWPGRGGLPLDPRSGCRQCPYGRCLHRRPGRPRLPEPPGSRRVPRQPHRSRQQHRPHSMHQGFSVVVIPLRLVGCTGSPVRIFVLWEA